MEVLTFERIFDLIESENKQTLTNVHPLFNLACVNPIDETVKHHCDSLQQILKDCCVDYRGGNKIKTLPLKSDKTDSHITYISNMFKDQIHDSFNESCNYQQNITNNYITEQMK
jgi:hypothetical protein